MQKIWNFCLDLWRRIDWRPNVMTWCEFILIGLILPTMLWANPHFFTEDGLVENIQLAVLVAAFFIALRAENQRKLFVFVALLVVFMVIRETNMFRGYFCEKYLLSGEICRWREFKYGYLAEGLRILFVLIMLGYFICRKLWQPLQQYICKAPIFIWDILIVGLMIISGTVAEFSFVDNEILEESSELICYIALANCIWRYKQIKI